MHTMGLILFDAGLLQLSMASRTDLYVNRINLIDANTSFIDDVMAEIASRVKAPTLQFSAA